MAALLLAMAGWTLVALESFGLLHAALVSDSRKLLLPGAFLWNYLRVAIVLLPLALLSGALFPVATRLLEPEAEDAGGEGVARAYAWNTLGALGGSLVGGFVLAPRLDYFQAIYLLGGLYAAAALAVGLRATVAATGGRLAHAALVVAALVGGGYALAQLRGESRFVTQLERLYPGWEVVFHRPGLQGVTSAIRRPGEREAASLLVNGQGMTVKATDTKMMAHVPMLAHPRPENVLVICFGMGTTFRSAISHGGRVTVVELVPEVFEAFDHFYADAERVRSYPRGRMVADDGRSFLKLTRERFDVITLDPPPPIDAAGVTNLYSREFVALARERLAPGGIFAHWIPFPGTKAGVENAASFHMLLATIVAEFPYVSVLPALNNGGLHVLASLTPIAIDPERLAAELAGGDVARDLREWQEVPAAFFARLAPWASLDLAFGRGGRTVHRLAAKELDAAPLLSDDRPRLEFDLWENVRRGQAEYFPGVWGG